MNHARPSIAAAIAVLLAANIVLGLVCELRCDVPASSAVVAGCHDAGASATSSRSSVRNQRGRRSLHPRRASGSHERYAAEGIAGRRQHRCRAHTGLRDISGRHGPFPVRATSLLPVFPPPRARSCGSDRSYKSPNFQIA